MNTTEKIFRMLKTPITQKELKQSQVDYSEVIVELSTVLSIDKKLLMVQPPFAYYFGAYTVIEFPCNITENVALLEQYRKRIADMQAISQEAMLNKDWHTIFDLAHEKGHFILFSKLFSAMDSISAYSIWRKLYVKNEYRFDLLIPFLKHFRLVPRFEVKKALLPYADKDRYLTIYRGATSQSTPISDAYSWTLDKKVALFFAGRFDDKRQHIYKGRIHVDHVLDYFTTEKEVLVRHSDISNIESLTISGPNAAILELSNTAIFWQPQNSKLYLNIYKSLALEIRASWFRSPNDIHGVLHTKRVLLLVIRLGKELQLTGRDLRILCAAALYHDIGRTHNETCLNHGFLSCEKYRELNLNIVPLTKPEQEMADFIIKYHSFPDKKAYEALYSSNLRFKARTKYLYDVFCDADNLDRVRLGDLDISYLRTPIAPLLKSFATVCLKEIQ